MYNINILIKQVIIYLFVNILVYMQHNVILILLDILYLKRKEMSSKLCLLFAQYAKKSCKLYDKVKSKNSEN